MNSWASTSSAALSGKLSIKSLQEIVENLRVQCYRDSTKRNYYRIWKSFNAFYLWLDVKPRSWEDHITLFIGHLISENKQYATIKSYLSTIRAVLKQDKVKLKEDLFLISSLTRACRIRND